MLVAIYSTAVSPISRGTTCTRLIYGLIQSLVSFLCASFWCRSWRFLFKLRFILIEQEKLRPTKLTSESIDVIKQIVQKFFFWVNQCDLILSIIRSGHFRQLWRKMIHSELSWVYTKLPKRKSTRLYCHGLKRLT